LLGFTDTTTDGWSTATGALAAGAWYQMAITYDGSNVNVYLNGVQQYSHANTRTIFYDTFPLAMGANNTPGGGFEEYFQGALDEVRLSKTARSAAWIATEYNNESSPSSFINIGSGQSAAATPTFSPATGLYSSSQTVTIGTTTSGATIRYTTDGTVPTTTTGTIYSGAITVSATTTIRAIAYAAGLPNSSVASATYTIGSGPAWYDTSWPYRKTVTISHTQVSGSSTLSNFPVLVSVTDTQLASVANGGGVGNSDGSDILFTASDGMTKLSHEIESYNPATGQLIAWVGVPSVSPTTDTTIYVYYGNVGSLSEAKPTERTSPIQNHRGASQARASSGSGTHRRRRWKRKRPRSPSPHHAARTAVENWEG
jgi:hypothetical protein